MKKAVLLCTVVAIFFVLAACGPTEAQKRAKAQAEAEKLYGQLPWASSGDVAAMMRADLLFKLSGAGLTLESIGASPEKLDSYVAGAYSKDAWEYLRALKKAVIPAEAKKLKDDFLRAQKLSGHDLEFYGLDAKKLAKLGVIKAAKSPPRGRGKTSQLQRR